MAKQLKKKRIRPLLAVTLDPELVKVIDAYAEERGKTRSVAIEQILMVGVLELGIQPRQDPETEPAIRVKKSSDDVF